MQSVELARLLSHIPPPRMGMERRKVMKFTRPMRLLLVLMVFKKTKSELLYVLVRLCVCC